jgi:hypothetical protein
MAFYFKIASKTKANQGRKTIVFTLLEKGVGFDRKTYN